MVTENNVVPVSCIHNIPGKTGHDDVIATVHCDAVSPTVRLFSTCQSAQLSGDIKRSDGIVTSHDISTTGIRDSVGFGTTQNNVIACSGDNRVCSGNHWIL